MSDVDVVVIGAGLAGLGAATALRAAGRSALVLEASGRIGGRAWTTHPAELGGVYDGLLKKKDEYLGAVLRWK